jgi:hypothetical protein
LDSKNPDERKKKKMGKRNRKKEEKEEKSLHWIPKIPTLSMSKSESWIRFTEPDGKDTEVEREYREAQGGCGGRGTETLPQNCTTTTPSVELRVWLL